MRRLLAVTAAMAASGLLFALPSTPATADGAGAGGGGGSYHAVVSISGNGAGSGGSLPGGSPVSGGGGSASVPMPCGYTVAMSQEAIEAMVGGDKDAFIAGSAGHGPDDSYYPVSIAWRAGILANWGKTGTWYLPGCDANSQGKLNKFVANNPPQLIAGGGPPPEPKVDPKVLEDIARRAMTLPDPLIHYNPAAGDAQESYVNVPGGTWFWSTASDDHGPLVGGETRTVTASLAGVSVTVTARLDALTFSTDGVTKGSQTVSCPDGGKAYTAGADTNSSSCKLEYIRSSGSGTYNVHAAASWSASSSLGTILAGSTMPYDRALKVGEIQTVQRDSSN